MTGRPSHPIAWDPRRGRFLDGQLAVGRLVALFVCGVFWAVVITLLLFKCGSPA